MGNILRLSVVCLGIGLLGLPAVSADLYSVGTPDIPELTWVNDGSLIGVDDKTEYPPEVSNLIASATKSPCDFAAGVLRGQGFTEEGSYDEGSYNHEWDPLDESPACEDLRDEIQHSIWSQFPPLSGANAQGVGGQCVKTNGRLNCVAALDAECDLLVMAYGNTVRLCVGGLSPYN